MEAFVIDPGADRNAWNPALVDGAAGRAPNSPGAFEVALNADIEPTSAFTIDKAKPTKNGKVRVEATLPNPGSLIAGDARDARVATAAATATGKRKKRLKRRTAQIAAPGQITLILKPTKSAKEKLETQDRLKAKIKLAFTPTFGTVATDTDKVRLKA